MRTGNFSTHFYTPWPPELGLWESLANVSAAFTRYLDVHSGTREEVNCHLTSMSGTPNSVWSVQRATGKAEGFEERNNSEPATQGS